VSGNIQIKQCCFEYWRQLDSRIPGCFILKILALENGIVIFVLTILGKKKQHSHCTHDVTQWRYRAKIVAKKN
jgi:hypothetical protein